MIRCSMIESPPTRMPPASEALTAATEPETTIRNLPEQTGRAIRMVTGAVFKSASSTW